MMQKKEIRKIYSAKRLALSPQAVQIRSKAISEIFFENFSLQNIQYLHIFLSIPEKKEMNTHYLIQHIWNYFPHIQLVTSVTDFQNNTLSHYALSPSTIIQINKWGVPEPINSQQIEENLLEMILIPLLGMDKKGNRVGYGKGYYDRFLEKCTHHTTKIGLSFFEPIDQITDIEKWDMPLDYGIYCDENAKGYLIEF